MKKASTSTLPRKEKEENMTSLTKQWKQQETKVNSQVNSKKLQNENNGHKMNTNKNKKVEKYSQASLAVPNTIKRKKNTMWLSQKVGWKKITRFRIAMKNVQEIQNYKTKSSLLLSKCLEYV